jgi:hypothetical protein|tara:strand:- start:571 stop:1080 length:510 start_codon:yes stop_codon:yes gene_type:complete
LKDGLIIVGFPKCGQVSLIQHLKNISPDTIVKKDEIIWNKEGVKIFKEKYGHNDKIKPLIIKRDPIKRIWSSYWYFDLEEKPFREKYTYEEYLHIDMYAHHLGELNPIRCSNYNKWINNWKELNPIIYEHEELIKIPNFPHLNKTNNIPEMTQAQYTMTKELLDAEMLE